MWRRALSEPGVAVIDAHFALYALLPVVASARRGQGVVVHFQGPWATEGRSLGDARPVTAVKRAVEAAVYRRADVCVVLSEAFGELLHKEFGVPRWAVHRVLPGVDLDTFAPGDQRKARRALGLDLDVWTAVTVRRLYPRMGLDVLLRSWSWLVSVSEQPVRLLIVGDGPERRSLEGQIARLGLRDSVKLLGLVDDDTLVDLFRAADLSVVPSVALEGFGLVVLESLACGTPALGTSAGGLPEVLEQLHQDLVVPANDADRLGHRLLKAATDPASVPTRQDCRAFAEHFTWEAVARSHLDLYRLVADRNRGGGAKRAEFEKGRRLRVVVVGFGAELPCEALETARRLPELFEVDVHVVLGRNGGLVDLLEDRGISVEVLRNLGGRAAPGATHRASSGAFARSVLLGRYAVRLSRRLSQLKPDLVHVDTLEAALCGGVAARLAGIPCVWLVRQGTGSDGVSSGRICLSRLCAHLLPDCVVTSSESIRKSLGLPPQRFTVIPPSGGQPTRAGYPPEKVAWYLRQISGYFAHPVVAP